MPKYDYRCTACGVVYEKREGFDAPPVQECRECQGVARRVLTPPAIVFKGSGWYKNDSRGSAPSGSASSDTPSTATPVAGDSSKSDAGKNDTGKSESTSSPAAAD